MRRNQLRSFDYKGVELSPSSFIIPIIEDSEFSPEPMVLLIYNHRDTVKRSALSVLTNEFTEGKKRGKPAGYGMPGGGVNPEWLETQEGAAAREGGNESGVRVIRTRPLIEKYWALFLHKKTGDITQPKVPYAKGKQPSVKLRPFEKLVLNPYFVYSAEVDWANSKPREFLMGLKNELLAEKRCSKDDVAKFGVSVNDLTKEELLGLGVDTEEVDEVGGFALLPTSWIRQMWKYKLLFLNEEEDRENRLDPTSYIYYSHVNWIIEGLDIMGII